MMPPLMRQEPQLNFNLKRPHLKASPSCIAIDQLNHLTELLAAAPNQLIRAQRPPRHLSLEGHATDSNYYLSDDWKLGDS